MSTALSSTASPQRVLVRFKNCSHGRGWRENILRINGTYVHFNMGVILRSDSCLWPAIGGKEQRRWLAGQGAGVLRFLSFATSLLIL